HPEAPLPPGAPRPGRPGPPPMNRPVGRPSPKRADRAVRGIPAPVVPERPVYTGPPRKITLTEGVTVKELGEKMEDVKSRDIIKALLSRGIMATVNQTLDPQLAIDVCKEFGYEASIQSFEEEVEQEQSVESKPEDLVPRAPVITVMGHVDHGKTSLLDAIRETSVAAGEAGGITQHIGAYHVDVGTRKVVFLDTPEAQPDRVKQQLSDHGLMPEEWGGNTVFVSVSAKKRQNLEQLLEMLLLVADLQELKANPKKPAAGTVLESRLDKGRGPVATVLVQDGTLHVSDTVVAGAVAGKSRALADEQGQRL